MGFTCRSRQTDTKEHERDHWKWHRLAWDGVIPLFSIFASIVELLWIPKRIDACVCALLIRVLGVIEPLLAANLSPSFPGIATTRHSQFLNDTFECIPSTCFFFTPLQLQTEQWKLRFRRVSPQWRTKNRSLQRESATHNILLSLGWDRMAIV